MMKATDRHNQKQKKAHKLEMNEYNAINRSLNSYKVSTEIVPVLEIIGNARDAGANNITIKLIERDGGYYLYIMSDGAPMSDKEYTKFVQAFETTKEYNNDTIGMWGVGAKLIMGSDEDIEMTVVNHNTKEPLSSVRFDNKYKGNERHIEAEENDPNNIKILNKIVSPEGNLYGTHSLLKIPRTYFVNLKKNLRSEVLRWYRPAIIQDESMMINIEEVPLESTIDEKLVNQYTEKIAGIPTIFSFYEVEDELPDNVREQLNHTVLSCAGKVIDVIDDIGAMNRVSSDMYNRVFCIADGTGDNNRSIKESLTLSKEDLQENDSAAIKWKKDAKKFVSNKFAELYPTEKKEVDNTQVSTIEKKQIKKHFEERLIPLLQNKLPEDKLKELLGTPVERGVLLDLRDPLGTASTHTREGRGGIKKTPENAGGEHKDHGNDKGSKTYHHIDDKDDNLEAKKKPDDKNKGLMGSLIVDIKKMPFGREQDPITGKYTDSQDVESVYRLEERDQGYALVINTINEVYKTHAKDAQRILSYDKRMAVYGFLEALRKEYPDIFTLISEHERAKATEG